MLYNSVSGRMYGTFIFHKTMHTCMYIYTYNVHVHVRTIMCIIQCELNGSSKSFLACVDECVSERESKVFTRGLLSRVNSRSTYMAVVMQGLDFCLSLDQARMV